MEIEPSTDAAAAAARDRRLLRPDVRGVAAALGSARQTPPLEQPALATLTRDQLSGDRDPR